MAQSFLADSFLGYSDSLALFSKVKQNVGFQSVEKMVYLPKNDFASQNILQFEINNASPHYIDLKSVRLNVVCKIVGKNGEKITPPILKDIGGEDNPASEDETENTGERKKRAIDDPITEAVGVVDGFAHAMWRRIDVMLQNQIVAGTEQSYPFLSNFKSLLYSSNQMKEGAMHSEIYYGDDPGQAKSDNWVLTENSGFKKRSELFSSSKLVEMSCPINVDVFQISKLIPGGVPLTVTLYPNSPDFCLMAPNKDAADEYKFVVTSASLSLNMVKVDNAILLAHNEILQNHDAIYPFINNKIKRVTLPAGIYQWEGTDPFATQVPSQLICALVKNSAAFGRLTENPFFFETADLTSISVLVDNHHMVNSPIQTQFSDSEDENDFCLNAYNSLNGVVPGEACVNPILKSEFSQGKAIYRFLYHPDCGLSSDQDEIPLRRTGNMKIGLTFRKPLPCPMTLLLMGSFPATLKIDKTKNVYQV